MPWLISLVGNLAAFFGLQLAKKTVLIGVVIAASVALTLAMGVAITNLLGSITAALPTDLASGAAFLPSNTSACISAVISAKVARFIYDWNMKNLEMASSIN